MLIELHITENNKDKYISKLYSCAEIIYKVRYPVVQLTLQQLLTKIHHNASTTGKQNEKYMKCLIF